MVLHRPVELAAFTREVLLGGSDSSWGRCTPCCLRSRQA